MTSVALCPGRSHRCLSHIVRSIRPEIPISSERCFGTDALLPLTPKIELIRPTSKVRSEGWLLDNCAVYSDEMNNYGIEEDTCEQ